MFPPLLFHLLPVGFCDSRLDLSFSNSFVSHSVASVHRLVVPNKGYSSLDQSPDEKPLVALDTDRWTQTHKWINVLLHKFYENKLQTVTLFCFVPVMMISTCLDTLRQDTPLLRWDMLENKHVLYFNSPFCIMRQEAWSFSQFRKQTHLYPSCSFKIILLACVHLL